MKCVLLNENHWSTRRELFVCQAAAAAVLLSLKSARPSDGHAM